MKTKIEMSNEGCVKQLLDEGYKKINGSLAIPGDLARDYIISTLKTEKNITNVKIIQDEPCLYDIYTLTREAE